MIGRVEELNRLDEMYRSDKFEFLIMYGRRRVGKTAILQEFAGKHRSIFFSAREKNDTLNLLDFSRITHVKEKHLIFISKSGYTAPVERRAQEEGALLLTLRDLFF